MTELPHIVRQRLAVSSGDHPDADLLTAFAERQLAAPERERVFAHLGTCAACREIVALAAPETIATQPVLTPARTRSWWSIRSYQYGLVAAALSIAAVGLVLLRPDRGPELQKVAQVATAPQTVPSTARSDAPANAAEKMQREPAAAAGRSEERARVAAGEGALGKKSFTISSPSAQSPKGLDALAATSQPADAAESKTVLADKADRQTAPSSSADMYAYSAAVPAPPSPQKAQPAQQASGAQAAPHTSNAAAKRAPATVNASVNASRETVEVAAEASGASVASSKINPPAESVIDPSASTLMLQQKAKTLAANKDEQAKQAALMRDARYNTRAGTWRINNGRLQKLDPSRNAFDDVAVSGASRLSVVASLGNEVWVGGTDGALHYSNDLGAHWIPVSTGGWSKDATFTGITPTALRSVEVHLSNGERWRSADAGASWSRYE